MTFPDSLDDLFQNRDVRPKPIAPPPPPTGLSRSDLLVLRTAAAAAKKPGAVVKKAAIIRTAVEAWRAEQIGALIGLTGDDGDRNAKAFVSEALGRLIELQLVYDSYPRNQRCDSPDEPAKSITLGKRGLALGAAVSSTGELEADSDRALAALRRKIVDAIFDAEESWAKKWPAASRRLRARCEKHGGDGRPEAVNLAATIVEPKRSPAELKAINMFLKRAGQNDARRARLQKLLSGIASAALAGDGKPPPIAAPE